MKASFAVMSLCAMCMLSGETRLYRETVSGKVLEIKSEFTVRHDGDCTVLENRSDALNSVLVVRPDGEAQAYEFRSEGVECRMIRDGNEVLVRSTVKGKPREASVKLGGKQWFGSFDQTLRYMSAYGKPEVCVYLINPTNPGKAIEFRFEAVGNDTVSGISAKKVKVCLTGALSALWSAYYWVDGSGEILKYQGSEGPGTKERLIEFVSAGD